MNSATELLRQMFLPASETGDVFGGSHRAETAMADFFAPEVCHSLFGPNGTKEMLIGRDAFLAFVARCAGLLASRRDEILSIDAIDEQCAIVKARAWRTSKASGEEIAYEWAMLYRVEDGRITYGADMLDSDAQAFWGRISA